jgi:hypothetical protein
MERFVTYCNLAFLDAFFRNKPAEEETDDVLLWHEIRQFLQQSAQLHVNVPEGDPNAALQEHPVLEQLLRNSGGGPQPHLDPEPFEKVETAAFHREEREAPHALFLVEETDAAPEVLSQRFGALFFSFEALPATWRRIGRYHPLNVSPEAEGGQQLEGWDDLRWFSTPLTGLVICDQYVFSKGEEKAKDNLYPLLRSLLPEEAGHAPVDITLVTKYIY